MEPLPVLQLTPTQRASLLVVDSAATLAEAAQRLVPLPEVHFLGLDSEWNPADASSDRVDVLQVAYAGHILVLDMQQLTSPQVDQLLLPLLQCPSVIPTGYAFAGDLARFQRGHADLDAFREPPPRYVELRRLAAVVLRQLPPGLAGLCRGVLQHDLDKTQQLSNWSERPLTDAQIHYAALDAVCSVRLAEELCARLLGRGVREGDVASLFAGLSDMLGFWDLHGLNVALPVPGPPVSLVEALRVQLEALPVAPPLPPEFSSAQAPDLQPHDVNASPELVREALKAVGLDPVTCLRQQQTNGRLSAGETPEGADASGEQQKTGSVDEANASSPSSYEENDTADTQNPSVSLAAGLTAKSISLLAVDRLICVLLRGSDKINLRYVRAVLGIPSSSLRLARRNECVAYFGYVPGTMPPLGFLHPALTLVDDRLASAHPEQLFVFSSGQPGLKLVLTPPQIQQLVPSSNIVHVTRDLLRADAADAAAAAAKHTADDETASILWHNVNVETLDKRFIADPSISRLVRWLRCAGFDTEMTEHSDPQKLIAAAAEQKRILLTISRTVADIAAATVPTHLMFNCNTKEQFLSVVKRFNLKPDPETFLMRCSKCNGTVVSTTHEEMAGIVPPLVLAKTKELWRCARCSQPFWQGSSYRNVTTMFKSLLGDAVKFIDDRGPAVGDDAEEEGEEENDETEADADGGAEGGQKSPQHKEDPEA